MQKRTGLGLISLVCFAAILVTGCTDSGSSSAPVTTPAPTMAAAASITTPAAPVQTAAPVSVVTTMAAAPATTASSMNDMIKVTLNSAKKMTTNYGGSKLSEGNALLELDVIIQNNDTNKEFEYTDSSFVISSSTNENNHIAVTTQYAKGIKNPFVGAPIPSGSKKDGQIVFYVTETSNNYKLSVVDSTGTVLASVNNIKVS